MQLTMPTPPACQPLLLPPSHCFPSPPPARPPADGALRLRPLPHPYTSEGLKVTWKEGSVNKVSDSALPCIVLQTSK